MEDKGRRLAADVKDSPHKGDGTHDGNRLTIMVMGSVGSVRSFKIAPRILYLTGLFFILYVIASVMVINAYLDVRRENIAQTGKVATLNAETLKTQRLLQRSKQQIDFLEDYIRNLEQETSGEASAETRENVPPKKAEPAVKPAEPRKAVQPEKEDVRRAESAEGRPGGEADQGENEATDEVVGIKDLAMTRENTQVAISLKLVNLLPDNEAVGGYIHIMAVGERLVPPDEWTYPREKLREGLPVNFRKGQPFRIQRFKPFRAKFRLGPDGVLPSFIRVVVYDQSGALLLRKDIEVNNEV